jgi:transposase
VLSDLFGKAGTELLEGLLAGKTVKSILETTENKQLKAKSEEIEAVAQGALSENDHFVLEQLIKTINDLTGQIKLIELRIDGLVNKCDLEVVCSVPGVGKLSGATVLAELGDVGRFDSDKAVASWCGLVPCVYQSAGVANYGAITKRGSKYLRWCMIEVAHSAVRSDGRFREMFLRISAKKGRKVAYVAVARKLLTIVWHLLVNCEKYVEEGFSKKAVLVRSDSGSGSVSLEAMIAVLRNAGYVVSGKG